MSDVCNPTKYREQLDASARYESVSDTDRLQRAFARLGHICSVAAVICFYTDWSDYEHAAGWMMLPDSDKELEQLITQAMEKERYRSIIAEFAKADWEYTEAVVKAKTAKTAHESASVLYSVLRHAVVYARLPNGEPRLYVAGCVEVWKADEVKDSIVLTDCTDRSADLQSNYMRRRAERYYESLPPAVKSLTTIQEIVEAWQPLPVVVTNSLYARSVTLEAQVGLGVVTFAKGSFQGINIDMKHGAIVYEAELSNEYPEMFMIGMQGPGITSARPLVQDLREVREYRARFK